MKKSAFYIFIITLLLQYHLLHAQQISNGFSMPESITSNGKRFFVSNQGQEPMSKDGDGFISEIDAGGKIINLKFAPKTDVLNAPKGLVIAGNILYVADLERIVGFDINSGQTVFELTIPGAKLLNDLCKIDDKTIAVTETVSSKVYSVDVQNKTIQLLGDVPFPNGVAYNPNTKALYICTVGENYGEGNLYVKTFEK